ncbi:hypothetical protein BB561_005892 [Smittium simulii]|uniref:BZIP domain-containing protein n=1 Tax=Smittium simulii TaxID=133385 RepID=A0A2T9Y7R6_9FUNG|nr:hypothetical protein BB561_005892 [Smittium simulii]
MSNALSLPYNSQGNKRSQLFEPDHYDQANPSKNANSSQKKAGRKPIESEPSNKRAAQNRSAQRAFRDRKQKYVQELQSEISELKSSKTEISQQVDSLKSEISILKKENEQYKKVFMNSYTNTFDFKPPTQPSSLSVPSLQKIQDISPAEHFLFSSLSSTLNDSADVLSNFSSSKTTPIDLSSADFAINSIFTGEDFNNFADLSQSLANPDGCLDNLLDTIIKSNPSSSINNSPTIIPPNTTSSSASTDTFNKHNTSISQSATEATSSLQDIPFNNSALSHLDANNISSDFNSNLNNPLQFSSLNNILFNDLQLPTDLSSSKDLFVNQTSLNNLPKEEPKHHSKSLQNNLGSVLLDHVSNIPIDSNPSLFAAVPGNDSANFPLNPSLFTVVPDNETVKSPSNSTSKDYPNIKSEGSLYSYLESINSFKTNELASKINHNLVPIKHDTSQTHSSPLHALPDWISSNITSPTSHNNQITPTATIIPSATEIDYSDSSFDKSKQNNAPQCGLLKNHELDELCDLLRINAKCSNELKVFCSEWENLKSETSEALLISSIKASEKTSFGI